MWGRGLAWLCGALVLALALAQFVMPSFAQTQTHPPVDPAVGADVNQSYFGPFPSEINRKLVGPVQLLKSGVVAPNHKSITIPLYRGHLRNGKNVWYILTDTTDAQNAKALGINFSSKLAYAAVGRAARKAWLRKDATLVFGRGEVDFGPKRTLVPGKAPNFFPPAQARPGSVGDRFYTPFVQIVNQPGTPLYNAPVVASDVEAEDIDFCKGGVDHSLVHDRVLAICPSADSNGTGTVTLRTTGIFSFAKPSTYLSTEASDKVVATLDKGTFAPALGDLPVGRDDSAFSPIERLFPIANGPTGKNNPQRQGLNSAVKGEGDPLHVIGGIPTVATDYSPAWDLNLGVWTQEAIDRGYRARVIDEFQLLGIVADGHITGPDGKPFGSTGIVVNCPIVERLL
ncbi:MAG: hypothetical protein H0V19_05100 [Euzebyales bacterium]|nr:hypothetical protein [Euzebyales bacterium]MBA3620722.1 hypothetical protein [Euzebyales bacterium]